MTNTVRIAAAVAVALVQVVVATNTAGRETQPRRNAGFHVTGAGGRNCGDMTNNLRTERQSWGGYYASYADGFITGANFVSYLANQRNSNVGYDISPEALFALIEQYCAQNPSKGIHQAVEGVYSQLVAR
jgi:hypothetical protein